MTRKLIIYKSMVKMSLIRPVSSEGFLQLLISLIQKNIFKMQHEECQTWIFSRSTWYPPCILIGCILHAFQGNSFENCMWSFYRFSGFFTMVLSVSMPVNLSYPFVITRLFVVQINANTSDEFTNRLIHYIFQSVLVIILRPIWASD